MGPSKPTLSESDLGPSDLPAACALVQEAGWNQTVEDWNIFLDLGSVAAMRNEEGTVVATAATLPYERRFAWISMVLVTKQYRGRGLARRLMEICLDRLRSLDITPVLDATPAGRQVYLRLGFNDVWGYERFTLDGDQRISPGKKADPSIAVHAISDAVWSSVCRYDARAFGADRTAVLRRLRGRLPTAELYTEEDGHITGFALGRAGRSAAQIGPVIADSEEIGLALLERALENIVPPVYIDVPDSMRSIRDWLMRRGFRSQRPLTRMVLGRSEAFDDRTRTMAVAGPELG